MEKERVLAYTQATLIENDELDAIAGGNAQASMHPTVRATGSCLAGADVVGDFRADF